MSATAPQGESAHGGSDFATSFTVNGEPRALAVDPRVTLLDALRDHLHLHGAKKGAATGCAAPARC